jgi:hypothetical protein
MALQRCILAPGVTPMLGNATKGLTRTTSGCDMPSRFFRKSWDRCRRLQRVTSRHSHQALTCIWSSLEITYSESHVHRTTHDKQQTRSESLEIPKRRASVARSVWRAVIQSRLLSTCPRRPVKTIPMMRYSNLGSVIGYHDIPRYFTVPERNAGIESLLGLGRFLSDPSLTKHLTRYVLKLSRRQ